MDEAEVEATGKTIARRLLARIDLRQSFNMGLKNNGQLRTVKKNNNKNITFLHRCENTNTIKLFCRKTANHSYKYYLIYQNVKLQTVTFFCTTMTYRE